MSRTAGCKGRGCRAAKAEANTGAGLGTAAQSCASSDPRKAATASKCLARQWSTKVEMRAAEKPRQRRSSVTASSKPSSSPAKGGKCNKRQKQ